ncbi:MAG: NTP transferase domain-containing protein [Clostridia bacterium]|nr:NTP transferase domain-containing protein [Clostridia bacterium]
MKAVIMAGGMGTRLRPLTYDKPKPLVELVGKSCILYILDLLKANGITDVCVTLMYLGEKIREELSTVGDMNIFYMTENEPLGTAGSVANCRSFLDGEDDFLVISGDCICDFSLKRAISYHKEKGGKATIVLSRVDDPLEYGIAVTSPDGSISGFVEKPSWSKVYSDTVNTGIYILSKDIFDYFPDKVCDFSKDVFPAMMASGEKIFAYNAQGYWCDIGNINAYTRCTRDILSGKVRVHGVLDAMKRKNVFIPENCTVREPSYIGDNVFLENALIGPYSVIGDGCRISNASVEGSVLLDGVSLDKNSSVRGSVICEDVSVGQGVSVGEMSVIGQGCSVGARSVIGAGSIVSSGTVIAENTFLRSERTGSDLVCDDECFVCETGNADLTCFFSAGIAAAAVMHKSVAVAFSSEDNSLLPNALAVSSGAVFGGADVYDCGDCDLNIFRFTVRRFGFGGGVYIRSDNGRVAVLCLESDGLYVRREYERKISQFLSLPIKNDDKNRASGAFRKISGHDNLYIKKITDLLRGIVTDCAVSGIRYFADAVPRPSEPKEYLHILSDGLVFQNSMHEAYSDDTVRCVAAFCIGKISGSVCVPFDYPLSVDECAKKYGFTVRRTTLDDPERSNLYTLCDPCLTAAAILRFMSDNGCCFSDIAAMLPKFSSRHRDVSVSGGRAAVMHELSTEKDCEFSDGIRIRRGRGSVLIVPHKNAESLRVFAEAADAETAAEICDFYVKKLKSR